MNENSTSKIQLERHLELTSLQQHVLEVLKSKQTEEYPLSVWYLGALYAINSKYNPDRISQAAQSLRELLEKLLRVIRESDTLRSYDFKGKRRYIHARFIEDKKRYNGIWRDEVIDSELDKTLQQMDEYLELNQQPTRGEAIYSAFEKNDPMSNVLGSEIQEEKSKEFCQLWKKIETFAHHQCDLDERHFMECFLSVNRIIIELFAPITAQDQSRIRGILEKPEITETDRRSMKTLITRRGANYAFFFKNANATWIPILKDWGVFNNPPNVQPAGNGRVSYPFWRPILYIQRVADSAPKQAVSILDNLQETNNPHILYGICEIACQLKDIDLSLKLRPWIIKHVESPYHWVTSELIANLLRRWGTESKDSKMAALDLLEILVSFKVDPMSEEKQIRRSKDLNDWTTSLEPQPRFDESEYKRIFEKGVNPIIEKDPFSVACILIKACASMIYFRMHQDVLDKNGDEDYSEIWCRRFDNKLDDDYYQSSEETLAYALAFACKKVYEQSKESIEELDQILRNQRWKIFKRLRQYLYALNPNEQTSSWIRKFIVEHEDYAKRDHNYEFQLMIRNACEYFGADFLREEEWARIFDTILSGPLKEDFRKRWGDEFTEEKFHQRQRYFRRQQLRPFAQVLAGKYQHYYQKLETDLKEQSISDEDYTPVDVKVGGMVSYHSPCSPEDMAKLRDEELLAYINEWSQEHWKDRDGLVEINIKALAGAFQNVFKDSIIPDNKRLEFWMSRRDQIERPVYVKSIIQAIQEHVMERNFEQLKEWLNFCDWVLSNFDVENGENVQQSDESRQHPNWESSRRAVEDFLRKCLEKKVNVPFYAREKLANLLRLLCTQFDWRLDRNKPVLLNRDNQIAEAINNTRSRALETLVDFGFWVRRYNPDDSVLEITSILEGRFKSDAEWPLTMPEHALLGLLYPKLYRLDKTWSVEHKKDFFPQDNIPIWLEAFGNFLHFNPPFRPTFEILKEDFDFALNKFAKLKEMKHPGQEFGTTLGRHLFTYYLWKVYPLKSSDSLLKIFYDKTTNDRQYWVNLFDYVGRSLRKSGEDLEADLIERIVAFFNWRFEEKESKELSRFTFWLAAKCLPADWRLDNYSKILDVSQPEVRHIPIEMSALNELLAEHTAKVVECFLKITAAIGENDNMYIQTGKAKLIMQAGLYSDDEKVRENAKQAGDNLLRCGHSDFWTDEASN